MLIVWLLIVFIVGVIAGFTLAAYAAVESDKKAVSDGMIKLCGKLFLLKELDL